MQETSTDKVPGWDMSVCIPKQTLEDDVRIAIKILRARKKDWEPCERVAKLLESSLLTPWQDLREILS